MSQEATSAKKYFLREPLYIPMKQDFGEDGFPGIYRLHVADGSRAFSPLPRLLNVDQHGTLYIGTSADVHARIGSLNKSVSAAYGRAPFRDVSPHQTGKKIALLQKFMERISFDRLCLTVEPSSSSLADLETNTSGHSILEAKLLDQYRAFFGENPPLNERRPS